MAADELEALGEAVLGVDLLGDGRVRRRAVERGARRRIDATAALRDLKDGVILTVY